VKASLTSSLVAVAGDLVLEVPKESSLLLGLDSAVVNNPLFIFEELAVLDHSLVNVGLSLKVGVSLNSSVAVGMGGVLSVGVGAVGVGAVGVGRAVDVCGVLTVDAGRALRVERVEVGEVLGISLDDSLFDSLGHDGLGKGLSNDGFLKNFGHNCISVLSLGGIGTLLVHNRDVVLLDQGRVLFVDNWLMMLMDVLLNDHWLMVLMDDLLMVLVEDVLSVFHDNVLVMLMNNVLMDLLHDGGLNGGPNISSEFVPLDSLALVGLLVLSLLLVSDHYGLLVDLLYHYGSTSCKLFSVGVIMLEVVLVSVADSMFVRVPMFKVVCVTLGACHDVSCARGVDIGLVVVVSVVVPVEVASTMDSSSSAETSGGRSISSDHVLRVVSALVEVILSVVSALVEVIVARLANDTDSRSKSSSSMYSSSEVNIGTTYSSFGVDVFFVVNVLLGHWGLFLVFDNIN
jgi:hypothetical protein